MNEQLQFYIITPEDNIENEIEIVCQLLKQEDVTLHLRKPTFSKDLVSDYLLNIPSELHQKIVIHSYHQLIEDFNLRGIHFTHHNKHSINNYLNTNCSRSISTHSFEEIKNPIGDFDYFFLSPIFKSTSKTGYGGNHYKMHELETFLKQEQAKNIVALSGIDFNNIKLVQNLGFSGAAFLGSFWNFCQNTDYKTQIHLFFKTLRNNLLQ